MLCVQLADVFVCVRNLVGKVLLLLLFFIVVVVVVVVIVSSHSVFIPGTSTSVPTVIPTALSSSFRLQYFPN